MNVTIDDLFATVGVDGFVVKTCGIFSWKHWWSWCGDGHKREADEKDEQHDEVENKAKLAEHVHERRLQAKNTA